MSTRRRHPPNRGIVALFVAACSAGALLGVWSARRDLEAAAAAERDPVLSAAGLDSARAGARRSRSGVPTFTTERPIETRPGHPGYDPMRLGAVMSQGRIFDQEPRTRPWADRLEKALRSGIGADVARIVPGLKMQDIECRTTICRLRWEKSDGAGDRKVFTLLRVLYAGSGGGSGASPSEIYLTYGGGILRDIPTGQVDPLLARLREVRKRRLASIRRLASTGENRFPEVAPSEWPAE